MLPRPLETLATSWFNLESIELNRYFSNAQYLSITFKGIVARSLEG